MPAPAEKGESSGPEERLTYLQKLLATSLKLKPQEANKIFDNEEAKKCVLEFLELTDVRRLFISYSGTTLVVSTSPPVGSKKKAVYFVKKNKVKITNENKESEILFGDLSASPLETLLSLSQEVVMPILSTSQSAGTLPEMVAKDVNENFQRFLANVYVTIGSTKGKTMLPLPSSEASEPQPSSAASSAQDKDRIHALESAVITWTRQIKDVLKLDPEALLKAGLNPGPMAELEFWESKSSNLNAIYEQLSSDKIRKVMRVLELTRSTYFPPFVRLTKEVEEARQEANEIVIYLRPLRPFFERLSPDSAERCEFVDLPELFRQLLHLIFLVWKNSRFYSTPSHLAILIRQICNDIIEHARQHVNAAELFDIEPPEAMERLRTTLAICAKFKNCYFDYKAKTASEIPANPWRIQQSALFSRMDLFLERCRDLLDLISTIVQFNKLEKVEVGGTKGKSLSASVRQVHLDFLESLAKLRSVPADVLDVSSKPFEESYFTFCSSIKELERRLANVVTQGFDDCNTVYSAFKLVESFEGLLEREAISFEVEKKQVELLKAYGVDLKDVQETFLSRRDSPPLYNNAPPTAGALIWVTGLLERINEPMSKFQTVAKTSLQSDEAKDIVSLYENLVTLLGEYERSKYEEWSREVGKVSASKLQQPLLCRDPVSGTLLVNFDPELVRLLREVNYLQKLNRNRAPGTEFAVPEEALDIFNKAEEYRTHTSKLDMIVSTYNATVSSLIDVEKPLLESKLKEIDVELEKGLTELNWKSLGINDFIGGSSVIVSDSKKTLDVLKSNVKEIQKILKSWEDNLLLFDRKDGRTYSVEEFAGRYEEHRAVRERDIRAGGETIHRLMAASLGSLKGISKSEDSWKAYESHVNVIVTEGIGRSILNSLRFLCDNVDAAALQRLELTPMLEIKLELVSILTSARAGKNPDTGAVYSPELEGASSSGVPSVTDFVHKLIQDFMRVASYTRRLDTGEGDYTKEMSENSAISTLVGKINSLITSNNESCRTFREQFISFAYLWNRDARSAFKEFLVSAGGKEPSLEEFDNQISKYGKIQSEIGQLPNTQVIGWLRVDARPIKTSLNSACGKWKSAFSAHLSDKVIANINVLNDFIERVNEGLEGSVEEGDMDSLKQVMGYIRDVRVRMEETDGMFDPLKNVVALLEKHDIRMLESQLKKLDESPMKWNLVKKKTFVKREELSPLQDAEAKKIKDQMLLFNEQVAQFRANFLENAPFRWDIGVAAAYEALDREQRELVVIEASAANLNNLQELFELTVSAYKDLKDCRSDIVNLKTLWDMTSLVLSQFEEWMKTPFKRVLVDDLVEETKKLAQVIKGYTKMRDWEAFKGLESSVRNMLTALPLVSDLRSPAMRDRHWKALLRQCGKTGNINPEEESFTLQQLLDLGLHNYVEDVGEIVDKASKELIIEKNLKKIEDNWTGLAITYSNNEDLKCPVLGAIDDIVEVLEDNQVQLQNMAANRFVEYFLSDVTKWQRLLGTVDSVINLWIEVQRSWSNLYPIFVLSADIKKQLPEDAKRFTGVDEGFRELMGAANSVTNVIEACCQDTIRKKMNRQIGIFEMLQSMQEDLERCEKSLADYLDTKRTAFPRFFFVAPADLVDILSKGSNPQAVMKHMSKLVDAIETLTFEGDSKVATGLISKEGEEVTFSEKFLCEGPVETWLSGVLETIVKTLSNILADAHASYAEQPRDSWLFNYCAQIAVVASRIWWTTEVSSAFERLEDGNETALKDYNKQQIEQLAKLTTLVQGNLESGDRKKIINMITVDVHARDVLIKLIDEKVDSSQVFGWQSQLRYSWDEKKGCVINIADAEFLYNYEYIGNCGCLVITPLTDRCYITLTQALRLVLGGAPAGPAGTGKTETTKDLSRALGIACYVFNCSDQMDYKSLGNIFKGLAMSGSWGCFDEFNRIPVEVLSVVATQFKSILDAIRNKKARFNFQGEEISLIPATGSFITMNPGYKGRTELPENLKALFRPCAMVVPDFGNISEIMLASEGFIDAKGLSKKFVTLYALNKELLSKQDHYDWGLRAIKSVLVIAGALKRSEPHVSEDKILMRALRDTNLAKLSRDDVEIFKGLIGDLFPKMELSAKRDPVLESAVREAAKEAHLQLGENEIFVLKVVQFKELLDVRHSVFVLGPAAAGKTCVWKGLASAFGRLGQKTTAVTMNPKAVTSNELYGYIHPATREWKDGLLSNVMRDLANGSKANKNPKWIVLDGDIDAEWIESMNTVMDDNKVLTLASNERIPLTASMRMVFEISHLKNATPATVSRAGILFLNETDIGWVPFKESWIETRTDEREKQTLERLFDTYVNPALSYARRSCKHIIHISDYNMIQTLCFLLEGLLTRDKCPPGSANEVYEHYFVWACIWAFGGALGTDATSDYRTQFSNWWRKEFAVVKFPDGGLVFDYYVDPKTQRYSSWNDFVTRYQHSLDTPFSSITVQTADTVRLTYVMNLLSDNARPVLLVGTAGTGKTSVVKEKLKNLPDEMMSCTINFNSNTDSRTLQLIMEQPLEKKAGRQFGPPGRKKLIYFTDDLNMPTPDKYNTQSAIALIRQHMDYGFWYDRAKMFSKEVMSVQYLAAMNPKAGSFIVDDRLQRHYGIFSCSFPSPDDLRTIYSQIMGGHLSFGFDANLQRLSEKLVNATVDLHRTVSKVFLPTAIKFHYQFNLRELSNIFQGLLLSKPQYINQPLQLIRLWLHECYRVFGDRLITDADSSRFAEMCVDVSKKYFDEVNQNDLHAEPLVFTSFIQRTPGDEKVYFPVPDYEKLRKVLDDKLKEYNDNYAVMNLELFEQAMQHVCRISRIIENPRGNALLVGVGGSGKQSLARLAAFINGYDTYQITVTSSYGVNEFKVDLQELYKRTGVKSQRYAFLFTDSQIVDERMLVYLNDILSSGYIPDLFNSDEKDGIIGSVSNEVKQVGGDYNNKEYCWNYFIEKVRANLHVVLCFSPVGEQFRIRCRRFPALINCTSIDWFHPWPQQALVSVAARFLRDTELGDQAMRDSIAQHMAFVHYSVNEASQLFLASERRYNYTTPKSFLEFISSYKLLLGRKRAELQEMIDRLETGLFKLRESSEKVADLQIRLKEEQVIVEEKKIATEELLVKVGQDRNIVEAQTAIAQEEEKKTQVVLDEVMEFEKQCNQDLAKAEPIVQAALAALNTLDKNSLTELKSFTKPAPDVAEVAAAVLVLSAEAKTGVPKDRSWGAAKKMMAQVDRFLDSLINFDKEHIPDANIIAVQPYINNVAFIPESIKVKSAAAAGLCSWVINIVKYNAVYKEVEPKRLLLDEARDKLAGAKATLDRVRANVQALQDRLNNLLQQFEFAQSEKIRIEEQAKKTQDKLELAARLVNGLADENVRWADSIQKLKNRGEFLVGDVLLSAAFLSYIGAFSRPYRESLLKEKWYPDLMARVIPTTPDIDILYGVLTDPAAVAGWNNEGLPSDRVSVENGTIVTSCQRWPLMIDPQLQGVKWIKNREAKNNLRIVQLTQRKYLDIIERAIQNGEPVLIENLGESIDAVLEPVLSRSVIKRGRSEFIKLGDKEVEYDRRFRLYLQTKMSNPHYRPEISAQTTMINFMVTEGGLEDQLLATVVNKERPDLEEERVRLLRDMNQFKIDIKQCEDALLYELSNAKGDILENRKLIENLEETKKKAIQIQRSVEEAEKTGIIINQNREIYRSAAIRGSLLFFQIDQLAAIDHMYQYSLESFSVIFDKALNKAVPSDEISQRCENIIDSVTETLFTFVSRGLFERHKLIFSSMLCLRILQRKGELDQTQLNFLLRGPKKFGVERPEAVRDWCSDAAWCSVQALTAIEGTSPAFSTLPQDMEGSWRRWKEWCELEKPEDEKLPLEWKNLTSFQKLLVVRCLRPDRITMAVGKFVGEQIGRKFVDAVPFDLQASFQDSGPNTPIFFILSAGVDPVKAVEALGRNFKVTEDNGKLINVSLGQGQEPIAEAALDKAFTIGGWVILNNIHLTARWLIALEKKLDTLAEAFKKQAAGDEDPSAPRGHRDFRVFLSADPSPNIPMGILQRSIKLTQEPPQGLRANLERAFRTFSDETWESSSKQAELKAILFSLCFFHAVIIERKKFGPQGWNRNYPFNLGDLSTCVAVCANYLEDRPKIPFEDLRYIFGEIMYGGHITDDIDRRLCSAYFRQYIKEETIEGFEMCPTFFSPPTSLNFAGFIEYMAENLPAESPTAYGLHPNAEIGFRTAQGDYLFKSVLELQPRSSAAGGGQSMQEIVKLKLDEILEKLPENYGLIELGERMEEERSPFQVVFYQECERMNILLTEMKRSLNELDLGLKGDLTISDKMQTLMNALFDDKVPESWGDVAYPSLRTLASWLVNLLERNKQLTDWTAELATPKVVWLSGLFNPQSFLTAIMQVTARKNAWPLDKMALQTEVTKKNVADIESAARDGALVHGLFLEGARWDTNAGTLDDAKLKELFPSMPVMLIKAVTADKLETRDQYQCPCYKTSERGPTFVFFCNLRTKQPATKWILAGVAAICDVAE